MKKTFIISIIILLGACSSIKKHKSITVKKAIEGIYTFKDNNSKTIGYLALYSGNYYFAFNNDISKALKDKAFKFHFTHKLDDNYKLKFKENIEVNSSILNYNDNDILTTIDFDPKRITRIRTDRTFLLRTDKYKKQIYFHSEKSKLQLWNISKPWVNEGISDKEAIVIANKEAEKKLSENKNNNYKLEDYNKKQGLIIVADELYWYVFYNYTFPNLKKNEMHSTGQHFTVRVNQKTRKTQFLYGE